MAVTAEEIRLAIGSANLVGQVALEDLLKYWTGSGAPTANADRIGREYLDTANSDWYVAVAKGTGANDWKKITP